jgi:hypothetical protein
MSLRNAHRHKTVAANFWPGKNDELLTYISGRRNSTADTIATFGFAV